MAPVVGLEWVRMHAVAPAFWACNALYGVDVLGAPLDRWMNLHLHSALGTVAGTLMSIASGISDPSARLR